MAPRGLDDDDDQNIEYNWVTPENIHTSVMDGLPVHILISKFPEKQFCSFLTQCHLNFEVINLTSFPDLSFFYFNPLEVLVCPNDFQERDFILLHFSSS